jgi:acyl-CoA reductase-like NAD-dependent aldehyde dehydrogenase
MSIDWIARAHALKLHVGNLIDGRRHDCNGEVLNKYSPRDGQLLYQFGTGSQDDVAAAVSSARRAFADGRWSKLPAQDRREALQRLAGAVLAHREEFALLESLDVGKPIHDALTIDISMAAAILQYHAEAADKVHARVYGVDESSLSYQLRRPVGVVAGIIGWNFPLVLAAMKLAPALAMGNTLVLKPSEMTSLSACRLAELALEVGIPSGVYNVIHGAGAVGAGLARHPGIDLITFTGSTQTGKRLMIASGESNLKRLILECGGKAPNIVFADAPDLDAVAASIVARAFWNQGQVCTASSRLLVQETVKDELLPKIIAQVSKLNPADPLLPDTRFAALVSSVHQQKVLSYIDSGLRESATVAYQSRAAPPHPGGFYVAPVIFERVSPQQRIAREEIFGPVLSVMSFRDEGEAIRIANDTLYGLSAIVWTQDLSRAHRMTQALQAGWITVNATAKTAGGPAEGVLSRGGLRQSGLGLEGGLEGLEAYTTSTAVQIFSSGVSTLSP